MKKKLTLLLSILAFSAASYAQWGDPVFNPTVAQDDIQFWTGTGSNRAVIAITWNDDVAGNIGIAWGVQWNGTTNLKSLMDTLNLYDPRLSVTGNGAISNLSYQDEELGLDLVGPAGYWWYNWKDANDNDKQSGGVLADMIVSGDFIDWLPMNATTFESEAADEMFMATNPNGSTSTNYPFAESSVQYWAGSGSNSAVVGVGFNGTVLVWGVRWSGNVHVSDLLDTINTLDSRMQIDGISNCYADYMEYSDGTTSYETEGAGIMYKVNNTFASSICSQNAADGDYIFFSDNFSFPANSYIFVSTPNGGDTPNPNTRPIAVEDIQYWVGSGDGSSVVVVSWDDEADDVVALAWGVHYDDEYYPSVLDLLDSIKEYDSRFDYTVRRHMGEVYDIHTITYEDGTMSLAQTNTSSISAQVYAEEGIDDVSGSDLEYYSVWDGDLVAISTSGLFLLDNVEAVLPPAEQPEPVELCTTVYPLPYTEDFSGYTMASGNYPFVASAPMPTCWTVLGNGRFTAAYDTAADASTYFGGIGQATSTNNWGCITPGDPFLSLTVYGNYDGTYASYVQNHANYGTRRYAILPKFDHSLSQALLTMDHRTGSYARSGASFIVGYIVSDTSDFTPLVTFLQDRRVLHHDTVRFSEYSTTIPDDARLTFLWMSTDTNHTGDAPGYYYLGIDNLKVELDPNMPEPVPVEATIAASDILYWVGEGQNQAIMAINWPDTALAWGYRFDGNKTVANMVNDITAADPRLSYTTGAYGIDDILFARAEGDTLRKSSSDSWWSSTNNGASDAGMGQPLHNNDFEKWVESTTGIKIDSTWVEAYGGYWEYTYVYPMTIHPVSEPEVTPEVPVEATIAASDILYWVGEGQNQAIMAINWPDTALAWGYRFDGNKTVANMVNDITAADPRLSYTTGAYGIDDILFARAEGDTLRKSSSDSWWSSTNNGASDAGMGQPLHNNDFEKWVESTTGIKIDSTWVEAYGGYWEYTYVYPMTIHPVSVPDTTGTNPQPHPEHGPFCGAVGTEGCDAIDGHSSSIVAWATGVSMVRGLDDIAVPDGPRVIYGSESDAVGPIDFTTTTAVSLGDGGSATVTFAHPIRNGEGPDFAVFENSFNDYFLELGFVEVSTDGERFVRFPATSLTQTETQVVSEVDPTFINNLAGKYRVGYGTPFDLEELRDSTGINIDSIVYVRIVDVVGSIDPQYATYDAYGHIVNDPYPTSDPTGNWRSGGFDLTGVAVMYENTNGSSEVAVDATIDQDAILFWTGNGQNSAVIAVNWAAPDTCLAWGVKWNGNATVQDLMDTIVAYDSRFTYTGTGMLSDIIYTADGHTFQLTAESASPWGNYWMYNINGAAAQEMFNTQQVNNGDFVKWGDPNSGIMTDSANWAYVWTTTVTPVSVPTVGIDDVKVAIEALWPNPTTDVVNVSINRPVKAELYDLNGRSMAAFNLHEGTNVISLAHLNAGVYMLRAEGTVMKVVKK